MGKASKPGLSGRERQIMDALYEMGEGSARDVHSAMPDPPSYSAVRAQLAILIEKERIKHRQEGARYLYSPAQAMSNVRESALKRLVKTFFGGSTVSAVSALVGLNSSKMDSDELDELAALIERERQKRR